MRSNVNYYLEELISVDMVKEKIKLNHIEADIELRSAFDLRYNLNTGHYMVGMSNEEKATPGSLYEYWLEQFDFYKIKERFGINFLEYISLPSFKMESMNETVLRISRRETKNNNIPPTK